MKCECFEVACVRVHQFWVQGVQSRKISSAIHNISSLDKQQYQYMLGHKRAITWRTFATAELLWRHKAAIWNCRRLEHLLAEHNEFFLFSAHFYGPIPSVSLLQTRALKIFNDHYIGRAHLFLGKGRTQVTSCQWFLIL